MMFNGAIKDAVQDVLARLQDIVPDWLLFLWTTPPRVWGYFFISLWLAYTWAKQGLAGGIVGALAMIFAFFIGRATI